MKREEIVKLSELQNSIDRISNEFKYIDTTKEIVTFQIRVAAKSIVSLNIHAIPELEMDLLEMLRNRYIDKLQYLKKQMEQLVLCTEVKGKPDFLPIEI